MNIKNKPTSHNKYYMYLIIEDFSKIAIDYYFELHVLNK